MFRVNGSDIDLTGKTRRVESSGGNQATSGNIKGGRSAPGMQASLAGRYATALFELARDGNGEAGGARVIAAVERSLSTVQAALRESDEFARLTTSPLVDRVAAGRAIDAAARVMALDPTTTSFLGVLAANRRLAELPRVIRAYRQLAAGWRGETSAEVTSAHPLTDDQVTELKHQLRARIGREVTVDLQVDPALLGGLVVRIGSQMIDSSIRTRLGALSHAMKAGG